MNKDKAKRERGDENRYRRTVRTRDCKEHYSVRIKETVARSAGERYRVSDVMETIGNQSIQDLPWILDDLNAIKDAYRIEGNELDFDAKIMDAYILGTIRGKQMERERRRNKLR